MPADPSAEGRESLDDAATWRRENGTLVAYDENGRPFYFTDYVHHGETVDVYASLEHAHDERGAFTRMVVEWDGDDWTVRAAP